MPTAPDTINFLLDQLSSLGGLISTRKMFGEYCVYLAGKPVGLVCDDQLYLKPTEAGRALITPLVEGPPYPGARFHFLITADLWEDGDWLGQLIQVTAQALPPPKVKAKKQKVPK
ncbi:MAG: hypothetical protein RIR18_1814 [Pseudomonadota bacterium]|jgi:DNA transformation protein